MSSRTPTRRKVTLVWRQFLPEMQRDGESYQAQLRTNLVHAIVEGRIPPGTRLPSSRELAALLGIARNTVVLSYAYLLESGYLESRQRSGYFVAAVLPAAPPPVARAALRSMPDWSSRIAANPEGQKWLEKPRDWQQFQYPFVYGQFDPKLFPANEWRECSRMALDASDIYGWAMDAIDRDDPLLVEQLRTSVLPRRGIAATAEEILITMGAQQALFLLAELLVPAGTNVAVEDPGYMDARNILVRRGARTLGIAVDDAGVTPANSLARCQYLYCTPSHHCPTGITMSTQRRLELLSAAAAHDFVIFEDDYDAETQYSGQPLPALKAMDHDGRVIYIGSVSKTLFPGVRIGYLVGPRELVARARQLRRLMIRHPPLNNQRALAFFVAQGHYDRLLHRTRTALKSRAECISAAMRTYLPDFEFRTPTGGSAIWVEAPASVDVPRLEAAARRAGIVIEPGAPFFCAAGHGRHLRLAFSSIPAERIEPGIAALSEVVHGLA